MEQTVDRRSDQRTTCSEILAHHRWISWPLGKSCREASNPLGRPRWLCTLQPWMTGFNDWWRNHGLCWQTLDLTNNWLWSKSDRKSIPCIRKLDLISNPKSNEQNSTAINVLWIPRSRSCNPAETNPAFEADTIWRHGRKPDAVTVALDYSWSKKITKNAESIKHVKSR